MTDMGRELPNGVHADRSRHGQVRIYFKVKGGKKIRLRQKPGTPEFLDEVACARLGIPYAPAGAAPKAVIKPGAAQAGTLDWLIAEYQRRAHSLVEPETFARRAKMLAEVASYERSGQRAGDQPFEIFKRKHVVEIRDALRETPGARNNVVKAVSALFGWAMDAGIHEGHNPAAGIERLHSGDGFKEWSVDEVHQFLRHHGPGSMARRAMTVILFTGLRVSDACVAGRQHIYQGKDPETGAVSPWLKIRVSKTRKSSGVDVDIPLLPEVLAEIGDAKSLFLIPGQSGKGYTKESLSNMVAKWTKQAGLTGLSAHGLRKTGATIAAENGASVLTIQAIWAWVTVEQVELYTRKARRRAAAAQAGRFLKLERPKNE